MCLRYEGINQTFNHGLIFSNHVFSLVFLMEAIFKIIAYGRSYFKNTQNQFDFFVVVSSVFDIALELMKDLGANGYDALQTAP